MFRFIAERAPLPACTYQCDDDRQHAYQPASDPPPPDALSVAGSLHMSDTLHTLSSSRALLLIPKLLTSMDYPRHPNLGEDVCAYFAMPGVQQTSHCVVQKRFVACSVQRSLMAATAATAKFAHPQVPGRDMQLAACSGRSWQRLHVLQGSYHPKCQEGTFS
jgi:hypothetical protein